MNRTNIKVEIRRLKKLQWSYETQDQIDILNHQLDREMGVPLFLRL